MSMLWGLAGCYTTRVALHHNDIFNSRRPIDQVMKDPATDQETITTAVGAWIAEFLWTAAASSDVSPEKLLHDLMYDRRHLFQGAGLCDALPWRITW